MRFQAKYKKATDELPQVPQSHSDSSLPDHLSDGEQAGHNNSDQEQLPTLFPANNGAQRAHQLPVARSQAAEKYHRQQDCQCDPCSDECGFEAGPAKKCRVRDDADTESRNGQPVRQTAGAPVNPTRENGKADCESPNDVDQRLQMRSYASDDSILDHDKFPRLG